MDISVSDFKLITLDYRQVEPFQGDLKEPLTGSDEKKILSSLKKKGKFVPEFVWKDKNGKYWTMDGHRRLEIYKKNQMTFNGSYKIKFLLIDSKDENDAKEKLLLLNSHYGKITKSGLEEFVKNMENVDFVMNTASFLEFDNIAFLKASEELKESLTNKIKESTEIKEVPSGPISSTSSEEYEDDEENNSSLTDDEEEEHLVEDKKDRGKATDDYVTFTEIMTNEQKQKLINTVHKVKNAKSFFTNAEALNHIIDFYILNNK